EVDEVEPELGVDDLLEHLVDVLLGEGFVAGRVGGCGVVAHGCMVASRSARLRGRAFVGGRQLQLEPADVAPGALLEADFPVDAGPLEAEPLVEADAGLVRQGDPGAGHAEAALAQALEEGFVEGAADAFAPGALADVNRDARAPAVCGTLVEGGYVGVADGLPLPLGDETGVTGPIALDSRPQLGRVRCPLLEGDGALLDVRRVDRRAGGAVAGGVGISNPQL